MTMTKLCGGSAVSCNCDDCAAQWCANDAAGAAHACDIFIVFHASCIRHALHCNEQCTNHMHAQCAMCAHERWQQQHNDNDDHNNIAMTTHQQSNSNNAMTMVNEDHDDDVTMQSTSAAAQSAQQQWQWQAMWPNGAAAAQLVATAMIVQHTVVC